MLGNFRDTTLRLFAGVSLGLSIPTVVYTYDTYLWGFPGSSDGKESACNAGDPVNSWVRKIP